MKLLKPIAHTVYKLYNHKTKDFVEFSGTTTFEKVPDTLINRHVDSEDLELKTYVLVPKDKYNEH